jgi:hypothetical protein
MLGETLAATSLGWAPRKTYLGRAWGTRILDWEEARWGRHWRAVCAGRAVSRWCQTATVSPGVVAEQSEPWREISCPCGHGDVRRAGLTKLGMHHQLAHSKCLAARVRLATCVPGTVDRIGMASSGWLGGRRGATDLSTAGVRRNKRCRGTKC